MSTSITSVDLDQDPGVVITFATQFEVSTPAWNLLMAIENSDNRLEFKHGRYILWVLAKDKERNLTHWPETKAALAELCERKLLGRRGTPTMTTYKVTDLGLRVIQFMEKDLS